MFVVVNTITVAPEAQGRMVENFRAHAPDLRAFEGFLGFEIWQTEGTILAVSRWTSREAFMQYPQSEVFKKHHKGMGGVEAMKAAHIAMYEGESFA